MNEFDFILDFVSKRYEVSKRSIMSRSREKDIAIARLCLYYLLHHAAQWPLLRIAQHTKRDHTTVLYGVRRFKELGGNLYIDIEAVRKQLIDDLIVRFRKNGDVKPCA